MKILHLPLNVAGSEQVGQQRGFNEVFETYEGYDYLAVAGLYGNEEANRRLLETVSSHQPDIIWAQLQETNVLTPDTWATIRAEYPNTWLTTWSGDARTYVPPYLYSILPHFDIFYNATDQEKLYEGVCRRYEFMPIAVDPYEVTTFKEVSGVPDIIFIGNHYGVDAFPNSRNRYDTMVELTREFGDRFGVYGTGWPEGVGINLLGGVPIKDQGSYYKAAKVVISMDHFNDMKYWSERRLWALASSTPVAMEIDPTYPEYFEDLDIIHFNESTATWAVKTIMEQYEDRKSKKNQDYILTKHTWTQRAQQIRKDYEDAQGK